MLFCSLEFALFFVVVFALYWATPWDKPRVYLLLVASFYFYACWNYWLALLIGVTTLMDYVVARGMDASPSQARRKLLLILSLVVNVGLLVYFKYANWFLDSLEDALHAAGASASLPTLSVILPVGISFYTFEAINYTVDVYRGKAPAERNLGHFMLFITFFPHLVAGPIVRAKDFLPQIRRSKRWDWSRMHLGVRYFLLGLFKKLAIADRMAQFADPIFADPALYRTSALWLGMFAYALQIYCDFSGYTDMALGCAHMLGYKLALNFNLPYAAANIAEFWHRWHISLSTWLRDYLFIPLGGSRGGRWATCRNLMITMTLGGLWHGANWTFVLWGVAHGLLLIGHRLFREVSAHWPTIRRGLESVPGRAICIGLTFLIVCLTWVLFRAATLAKAGDFYAGLLPGVSGLTLPLPAIGLMLTALVVLIAHLWARWPTWQRATLHLPPAVLGLSYSFLLMVTLVLAPQTGQTFIYFQF